MSEKQFAVMGNPIAQSLSPTIHQLFASQFNLSIQYEKLLIDEARFEEEVEAFFKKGGLGLNITLPFKERAFSLADEKKKYAMTAKASNTLSLSEEKTVIAENTDGLGLIYSLQEYTELKGKRILLLGAGGAARGVVAPLLDAGIHSMHIANRTLKRADAIASQYENVTAGQYADLTGEYDVIINATSLSLQNKLPPIDGKFYFESICMDMVYGKKNQGFVEHAKKHGARESVDGLHMLVMQAAFAFMIWHKVMPDVGLVLQQLA